MLLDRRTLPRHEAGAFGVEADALLRPGVQVQVLNISRRGALLEGPAPCRPGSRTELAVGGLDGRRLSASAVVLRCWVACLLPLRFRCAVAFDRELPCTRGSG